MRKFADPEKNILTAGSYWPLTKPSSNMALNLALFGRWSLRDKAAQRRLALG